jgi:hypothetical protein
MKFFAVFKSASAAATSLTAWSAVILLLKIFLLNQWPAPFDFFYDFGVLSDAILTSIIASYVFYLIVIHLKELNDQETILPYVDAHTMRIVSECEQQISDIAKLSGVPLQLESLTVQSLTAALTAIAPYSAAPLVLGAVGNHANWFQYFDFHKQRTKESISKVLAQLIYLNAKHVSLLVAIDDCAHFSIVQHFLFHKIGNPDLSSFASTFHEYCQHSLMLKKYVTTKK